MNNWIKHEIIKTNVQHDSKGQKTSKSLNKTVLCEKS